MYSVNLGIELVSLQNLRGTIERRVLEARDCGEVIELDVSRWLKDAGRMENDVQQLIEQVEARMHCFACSCPNIKRQYRLGKQAEEKIAAVKQLAAQGSQFDVISYPRRARPPPPELEFPSAASGSRFDVISHTRLPPPEVEFPSAENYVHLDSRTQIFEDIVGALRDPEVKMIGVYGQGGVGKTTLVETVAKKMLDDGTFKQVPLVAVSMYLNVKDIQKKLADRLNFTLDATEDVKGRAMKLCNKFKNGENYLIILDDIWQKVNLKAIGIPVMEGNIECKVVLTSRNEDLLRIKMKADRNFRIRELPEGEAWDLFKKKVGNTIGSRREIDSLAQQVCRKCKGMPVTINALGAALEDKPVEVWKNALDKLEKHMLTQIENVDPSVWASLWMSFNMLPSAEARSCFLLCCLFAEDAEIPIDELMRHCMARSLLNKMPRTFDEARTTICRVVDFLKSASLLSTGDNETVVKIPVVLRDLGISYACEEEAFLVDHGAIRWPQNPTNEPSYKAMSLSFKNVKGLPDGLVYPLLQTLMVANSELSDLEFPDTFFNGMMRLTVLTCTRMHMRRLPSSLAKLTNLQMLYLNECELDDFAILKDLKSNLEVLSLRNSSIEALPLEIGQLTSLRVLDLQDCDELKVIPRGVISNLTSLEELYFPKNFVGWEPTIDEQQHTSSRENVSLEELKGLLSTGQLSTLHIYIPADVKLLPKDDLIFANLKGFKISVGPPFNDSEKFISGKCMLKLKGIQLRNEFIPLVDKAEVVVLSEIEDLKKLFVQRQGLHRLPPFNNLIVLIIEYCKLKYLFSPTTAKELVRLEKLEVTSCEIMEGIVGFEGRNDEDEITSEVKFNKLKKLKLVNLPKLLSFYAQKEKMGTTMGSSSACVQPLFSEKVTFPVLEKLELEGCKSLRNIFHPCMVTVVENLRELIINDCSKMEVVIDEEGVQDGQQRETYRTLFPRLSELELRRLPALTMFCNFTCPLELPLLSKMIIHECRKMDSFSLGRVSAPKLSLKGISRKGKDGDDSTKIQE